MSWPTEICKCGHKLSEHGARSYTCLSESLGGICPCNYFRLDPDAIAHGHNPATLTQEQVGTAEGWRLLDEEEFLEKSEVPESQFWRPCKEWSGTEQWSTGHEMLRTRLTRAELRAARGITVGSAGGAPADSGDELLRALNILHWHFSYDLRLLIPKMLSEASPPILVKLNPDGKTFRRPVSQLQSATEIAESNASDIGSGAGARPAPVDSGEKLDLEALARISSKEIQLRDKEGWKFKSVSGPYEIILSALQQTDAAAREESRAKLDYVHKIGLRFGMMKTSDKAAQYLMHTWEPDSDHERMFREWTQSIGLEEKLGRTEQERDQARAEVERLRVENDMFRERSKYNRQVISSALSKFGIALAAESGGKPGIGDAANQFSEMLSGCRAERDELRAEVERLNARASADEQLFASVLAVAIKERDNLRAEVERLKE